MDSIWEPVVEFERLEKKRTGINFCVQKTRVSPYMELQTDSIYEEIKSDDTDCYFDVNPYKRFSEIFDFITSDDLGYTELNEGFGDMLLQFLADIDIQSGLCKREFYIRFFIKELEQGTFGNKETIDFFSMIEKRALAKELITLYETSDYFSGLMRVVQVIFPFCEIYVRDKEEVVFFMKEKESTLQKKRLLAICELFLPITYPYVIHWQKTYGVIGHDSTMRLEDFIL